VQYYIVETRGERAPGYELYSRFFSATVPIFIVYNVIYPLLGLLRIRRYRREVVNYSADEGRSSVGWMYRLIVLIWLTLPISSGVLFVHKSVFFASALTALGAFLPIFQYLFICYNLMAGNYIIIQPPEPEEKSVRRPKRIDRQRFETYMRQHKPWLDPKLRITDLCVALHTNRSYLSSLINSEYGMNFSRYINQWRLEELNRLRLDPKKANALGVEMVLEAGFSSYRSYLRVKADEDARNVVKGFD
jgi:AraC-like DNA-binding protein